MIKKKYTIKDIAHLAGVSKGTVDRVLHNRGKVSKKAHDRVDNVLREIDYQPNPIARNLKENKVYKICVLIPDMDKDAYWIPAHEGILKAAKEFQAFGIVVDEFFYHPQDKDAFIQKSDEALSTFPDVLLLAPLFQKESLSVLRRCREKNVKVAFFNNYIDAVDEELFIGQDLFESGKVAAGLIAKTVNSNTKIAIIHVDKEPHMQLKENGFKAYFRDKKQGHLLLTENFNTASFTGFSHDVSVYLKENQPISALFVTNSKAYKLVSCLIHQKHKPVLVGYDLLAENIECLKNGTIDFLIHQKPERQAYLSVSYFAKHFLFGKKLPNQKYLPIDIISAENVDFCTYGNQS